MVEHFDNSESLALMVPAEGTRGHVDYWKSGFYHIARSANVPVVLSYLDVSKKVSGVGPTIELTGNVRADMDKIREFYSGMQGFRPENMGVIRLREEDVEEVIDHGGDDADADIERLAGNL
jgi:1-acyl-sn-glycerol-3-phosphate acyltransferase